jgi:hypothetical protein
MAVPVDPVATCQIVEEALSVCEDRLSVARAMISPILSTTFSPAGSLDDVDPVTKDVPVDIIVCSLMLGALMMLHIIRQAWYLWGGENAFAFPFDRYVVILLPLNLLSHAHPIIFNH